MCIIMNVFFSEPPPEHVEGGIDLAMSMLETHLEHAGIPLQRNLSASNLDRVNPDTDVVHFHGLWQLDQTWASFRCRRLGIPYIVSPHGMLEPWAWNHKRWKKQPFYRLFERAHLNGANAVLATSELEAQNLRDFVEASLVKPIPLALPVDVTPDYDAARCELDWAEDETVLVYLSRIHKKKGLHLLLKALALLNDMPDKTRLVVVGDGPNDYLDRLHRIIDTRAASLPPVEWTGSVWGEQKWRYLQGADLFCLPTHSENFGLVVLEASQVGTPVLTTDQTPWKFLEDWGAGIITEPRIEAIRNGLEQFFSSFSWDIAARSHFAKRTREHFDLSVVGPQYVEVYRTASNAEMPTSIPPPSSLH